MLILAVPRRTAELLYEVLVTDNGMEQGEMPCSELRSIAQNMTLRIMSKRKTSARLFTSAAGGCHSR